jgi:hypothetical protein
MLRIVSTQTRPKGCPPSLSAPLSSDCLLAWLSPFAIFWNRQTHGSSENALEAYFGRTMISLLKDIVR